MYTARIETDAGKSFDFSYQNGVVFDITPLSGVDVTVSTSQGFQQVGTTVESVSVGGIRRTISGVILNKSSARMMLSVLTSFSTGRLYFNGEYFCPITVQKSPTIATDSRGRMKFTMQVFCETPYWYKKDARYVSLGGITPIFSFPAAYNAHKFGERRTNAFINVHNPGDVPAAMDLTLIADGTAVNYGIANTKTGEILRFADTVSPGDRITLSRKNGKLEAQKTSGGETSGAVAYITDESTLFDLSPGDNVLAVIADDGANALRVSVSFYPAYMGVLP